MRVRFWGTRGSIATPGGSTVHFGGNTLCVELLTNAGQRLIFDCGTGARALGLDLMANAPKPIRGNIMLSHTHWDHIQGFPFFTPLFVPGNEFRICAPGGVGPSLADVLGGQMEYAYFPVELSQLPAKIAYCELTEGVHEIDGLRVVTQYLNHPATTLGYRVEADGVAVLYLSDHEPFSETLWRADAKPGSIDAILHAGDRRHAEFMLGADLVIHDAQYTPAEYPAKKNWGHSTYQYVVELAAAAEVRRVALIHHDPLHDDAKVREIETLAKALAAEHGKGMQVFCAYEGGDVSVAGAQEDMVSVSVASTVTAPERTMRILVVDDDANVRLLAQAALSKAYTVVEAEDGEQCLTEIQNMVPDLIVLDLKMPKMGGFEVLEKLRAHTAFADIPVLILTAYGDEGSTRAGFDAGAVDFLTKPFTIPQLNSRVHACLTRNKVRYGEPGMT
ncbi:MAG TPA: response regulator [Acidobacteriaceae bacterium]|nr:response regulator [Acidobacteriaceae bacterium]